MKRTLLTLGLMALAPLARAQNITPANLVAGKLVPGSTSPDGKLCLLEVFHDDTTQNSVIFATTDRQQNLGYAPTSTEWSTDRPYKGRTTVMWSPDSTRVAVHDTLAKHSTLEIRRLVGGQFEPVSIPDLLLAACQRWGISRAILASSGQRPTRWTADDTITVQVSAKLKSGGERTTILLLSAPKDGTPTIQSK